MSHEIEQQTVIEGATVPESDSSDQAVTFREFRVLSDSFAARLLQEEAKAKRLARDRMIGWFLTALFLSAIFWLGFAQVRSEQELRQSLYETCLSTQAERADTAKFYRTVEKMSRPGPFNQALADAIARLETPRDCAGKYLS